MSGIDFLTFQLKMTLSKAYWVVHAAGKNFVRLYPTLHQPTRLPYVGTFVLSTDQLKISKMASNSISY